MNPPTSPKILVVDDEPMNIKVLQILLKAHGYTVIIATNGLEALEQVRACLPDLILLDVRMPKMDGFEVCQQFRAEESTQFIPIVMVTAFSEKQYRLKAIEVGADDFITKPIDSHEVLARVRSLLRIKQYHDALEAHNDRLEEELKMARKVQDSLMPQGTIDLGGFRIFSHYTPEMTVGGDFFDLWEIERGRLGVFISDVMGHGVSAAFVTMLIKTIVEEVRAQTDEPARLLEELNTRFNKLISSQLFMFATAFCGVLDLSRETLCCANAGHPFPFLIQRRQRRCEPVGEGCIGNGLGLLPNSTYTTCSYPFGGVDGLFLYTDGAYEIRNLLGEEFSPERIQHLLIQQISQPGTVLIDHVLTSIDQFSGGTPNDDDITVVAIDVNPME